MADTDTAESDDGDGLFELTREKLLVAAMLLVGIAGSGLARRFLGEFGYDNLGVMVYVVGYAGAVLGVWYVWIRPLDITGPD